MKVFYRSSVPECATEKEFKLWRISAKEIYASYNFCTDCTREYKERMIVEGRCEKPDTIFLRDKDGFLFGRPPFRPMGVDNE